MASDFLCLDSRCVVRPLNPNLNNAKKVQLLLHITFVPDCDDVIFVSLNLNHDPYQGNKIFETGHYSNSVRIVFVLVQLHLHTGFSCKRNMCLVFSQYGGLLI